MNTGKWIVLLCMLLSLGCGERQEGTRTSDTAPGVNTPPAPPTASEPQAMSALDRPSKLGDPAWPLTGLTWVKGGPVEIKPGTVYVVEFWATWCPPCRVSIPHLTELQRKYKDRNVVIVGISTEKVGKVEPFVEQKGSEMEYTVAVDTTGAVSGGYMDAFNRNTIPSAFVVGADGKILWVGHPMDSMDAVLEKAVAGMSGAQSG